MSAYHYDANQQDAEQDSVRRYKADHRSGRTELPRWEMPFGPMSALSKIWRAGNGAVNQALGRQSSGQLLDQPMLREMERGFGTDLSGVRLHNDPAAWVTAEALGARAFTHGDDIYLGADAPSGASAEGKALLAHELAHVVQQRQAGNVDVDRISQPGNVYEQGAEYAAQQALMGKRAVVSASGAPPGIQRQQRKPAEKASRTEAQAALEGFLRRALQMQGGHSLQVTPEVRDAVGVLFTGDFGRRIGIDAWLRGSALPGDPAEFASQVARRLPESIDRGLLEHLAGMAGSEETTRIGRVRDLIKRSAPAEPQEPIPAREPGPEKRAEQIFSDLRRLHRQPGPNVGPYSVDVLRLGRIASGLPGAWRGPGSRQPQLEARDYPAVEQAIQRVATDALIPAQALGSPTEGNYAAAQEVARDLARKLDIAQQQHAESVTLRLGVAFDTIQDSAALVSAVERIVFLIRDALPHHAAGVSYVDVFGYRRWFRRIPLRQRQE